ncbi:MAG: hypothetical protein AAFY76_02325, partial [Cyanobacteria bacterium J06649_11]
NIHPVDAPMIEVGSKKYQLGKLASKYDGFLSAAEFGKSQTELLLPILLANTPDGFDGTVKLLVPNNDKGVQKLITTSIIGTHEFRLYSGGAETNALVAYSDVTFVRETEASARYAFDAGILNADDVCLVIDIGGGTTNIVVCDVEDGFYVRYSNSYPNQGGINLAQKILATDLVRGYGKNFEVAKVMEAIANGYRTIGRNATYTFEPVYSDCVDQWLKAILSKVMSSIDKHLDDISKIVWTGGGAEIIRHKVADKPMHLMLPEPQRANLYGLMGLTRPHLTIAA